MTTEKEGNTVNRQKEGLSYNQTIWDIGAAVCLPLERSHKKCL